MKAQVDRLVDELKRRAVEAELEVIEKPNGHYLVIGGEAVVRWWPLSRRLTAYVEGSPRGITNAMPRTVIALASGGGRAR